LSRNGTTDPGFRIETAGEAGAEPRGAAVAFFYRTGKTEMRCMDDDAGGIFFEELSSSPAEFLSELSRPGNSTRISPAAAAALRDHQVSRLEANIGILRKKQEEFNRKLEEYVQGVRALIQSLNSPLEREGETPEGIRGGTQVSCLGCGAVKVFKDIRLITGQDSPDSIPRPTELIVDRGGTIKKGIFHCPTCGHQHLLIREK